MADRSVVVRLTAQVGQYVAGMRQAAAATTSVARQSQSSAQQASAAYQRQGGDWGKLSKGMAVAGGAIALGLGAAVKTTMDFDSKMSSVRANVDGSEADFAKLTEAVKTQGTQFGFSALESADAANDLAKAGLSATEIIGGGLTGALTLAAAGGVSAGDAAETAATAMTMFGLSAQDIPHIADLLASGADKSTASVESLSQGLMEGGSLAKLMGVSIEDTTAALAEFDQSGLKGAKAGNALKTMFQNMLDPSKKQQEVMDDLNLSFFDAQGKFIGLSGVAGQLQSKLGGLDDKSRNAALSVLFGARSVQAANILYKDGAKGVEKWQKEVNHSGFAAENARAKMDNLAGDLKKAKSALIEFAINGVASASTYLRPLTQGITNLLGVFSQVPAPVAGAAFALAALAAGGLLLGAGLIKIVGTARSVYTQVNALRGAMLAYNAAQVAARGSAIGMAQAQAIQAGTMAASARSWTSSGAAIATLANGQKVIMGTFGSTVALLGSSLIPTLGRMQTAYMSAAAAGGRFAVAQGVVRAAAVGSVGALGALGLAAAAAAAAYGLHELNDYVARSQVATVKTKELASSMTSLKSGTAAGGIADLFRESGSSVSIFGKQIGASREKVVTTSDVVSRLKDDLDTLNVSGFKKGLNYIGMWGGNMDAAKKRVSQLDAGLTQMVKGGSVDQAREAFKQLTKGMNSEQIDKLKKSLPGFTKALAQVPAEAKKAASPTKQAADAIEKMGNKSKDSADDVDALAKAIKGLADVQLGARGSARGYQQSLDDATKALKENGKTLDITTEKGRNNQAALDDIASKTTDWASSQFKLTGSQEQANAILAEGRKQYIGMATAMGMPAGEAKKLANELFKLPKEVQSDVKVDGTKNAIYEVDKLGNLVVGINGKKITIPADAPNAAQTATLLYAVKDAAVDAKGQKVTIPTSAIDSATTRAELVGIKGARQNADGSVTIPTKALNADKTNNLLRFMSKLATDADGKNVVIPSSVPNAPAVISLIKQIHGAQISANGKKVTITSSAPMAANTRFLINNIRGAQVSADGKSVTINSSVPGYSSTIGQIQAILDAARDKTFTVTAKMRSVGQSVDSGLTRADGGVTLPGGHRAMAQGGFNRQATIARGGSWITWAEDETGGEAYIPLASSKRPRSLALTQRVADYFGYDLVRRAADGYMSDWARAVPVQTAPTVIVEESRSSAGGAPIRIQMNNVPMDNANAVAKELIYSMGRHGIGKWARV